MSTHDRTSDPTTSPTGGMARELAGGASTALAETPPGRRPRRRAGVDATLAAAVDAALGAALQVAEPGTVGEHLGATDDGDRVVSHGFACTATGYRGWRWSVTLARAPRSRTVTVSEVMLLPGEGAVLAPAWVPWSDRLAPGDLSPGDVLPRRPDDPLLEQGYEAIGVAADGQLADDGVDAIAAWEWGLGRPRVLSLEGRAAAASRWYEGEHGPRDPHAEQASASCVSCGYLVPMAGALRQLFGVCASEWSPSDGRVVSYDHGCGAHSEVDVAPPIEIADVPVLDELGYVDVTSEVGSRAAEPTGASGGTAEGVEASGEVTEGVEASGSAAGETSEVGGEAAGEASP
ncbi:MAG: DUF3027 domain-containing protein [Angustibacter sp.]